jgi:hypothetical protein
MAIRHADPGERIRDLETRSIRRNHGGDLRRARLTA